MEEKTWFDFMCQGAVALSPFIALWVSWRTQKQIEIKEKKDTENKEKENYKNYLLNVGVLALENYDKITKGGTPLNEQDKFFREIHSSKVRMQLLADEGSNEIIDRFDKLCIAIRDFQEGVELVDSDKEKFRAFQKHYRIGNKKLDDLLKAIGEYIKKK